MKVHVLTGSKSEIAEKVSRIDGAVHEAIVFVEEPLSAIAEPSDVDIFAEMEPFMVRVGAAEDSRESLYTRMEGE